MPSELIFRAQLVLPEQRQLYDYWCRTAGMRDMPARQPFFAGQLPKMLPSLSLLSVGKSLQDTRFEKSGCDSKDVYGEDITGKSLMDLNWGEHQHYWMTVYQKVIQRKKPLQGVIHGAVEGQKDFVLFWLRLPISSEDADVEHIVCHDTISYTRAAMTRRFYEKRELELSVVPELALA